MQFIDSQGQYALKHINKLIKEDFFPLAMR